MDFALWPFLFLCLNGCYAPPQMQRGQVERLPEAAVPTSPVATSPAPATGGMPIDEQLRLAGELADPAAWAERVFAAGRPDMGPARLIELGRRGVPVAHLEALHARELRAREADTASRVAEREKQLGRRYEEDLRRLERSQPPYSPYRMYSPLPVPPGYPLPYGPGPHPYPYPYSYPSPYWR